SVELVKGSESAAILVDLKYRARVVSTAAGSCAVQAPTGSFEQAAGRCAAAGKIPQHREALAVRTDLENRAAVLRAGLIGHAVKEAITGLDDRCARRPARDGRNSKRAQPLIVSWSLGKTS